jgi:hypothetical protein
MNSIPDISPAEEFARFLEKMAQSLEEWSPFRSYVPRLKLLASQFRQPFNLAVVGRMKTGKSTLINALVGQPLALSDVEEATATINWICYGDLNETFQFLVHKRDGLTQSLPLNRIGDFAGKEDSNLARVREVAFLQFFAAIESLKRVQIVDTPGTGSAVDEHENVATSFLDPGKIQDSIAEGNKADAVIYVIPPVGRESDVANLEMFGLGRITGGGPYNSICVLHKWDGIEEEDPASNAQTKADKLKEQLKDKVITVIPVSGPLALAAKHAPDSYFVDLMAQINCLGEDELKRKLAKSSRWDAEQPRFLARMAYNIPWASFVLLCRLIKSEAPDSVSTARHIIRAYSRIDDLWQVLEEKFFSRISIIKGLSVLQRSAILVEPLIREIQRFHSGLRESLSILTNELQGTTRGTAWLLEERSKVSDEVGRLQQLLSEIDRSWLVQKDKLELLNRDLNVLEQIEVRPNQFPLEERSIIAQLCNYLANLNQTPGTKNGLPVSEVQIQTLINRYRSEENGARPKDRMIYSHLVARLEQLAILPN